jgi:hypothetical protein
MNLAQTCFGTNADGIQAQIDLAAEFGFSGVVPLPGDHLATTDVDAFPSHLHGRVPVAAWSCLHPPADADQPASPSSTVPEIWSRAAQQWSSVRSGLLQLGAKALILDVGFLQTAGAKERGEKLLMDLLENGEPGEAQEALEPLQDPAGGDLERQLDALARFLHGIHQRAPGLILAVTANASPAALLRPDHLQILRLDAGLPWLSYWHDCGNVQTRAAFGMERPGDWLDAASGAIAGCTLQDWAAGRDLLLPGEGQVDFQMVSEYLPRPAVRVLAAAPVYPIGSLPAAREALASFGIR